MHQQPRMDRKTTSACTQACGMQDLTGPDIQQYIYSHLNDSVAYAELRDSHAEDVDRLVGSLLDKARGVFLWVRIVTDVVLGGMEAGQTILDILQGLTFKELWARIRECLEYASRVGFRSKKLANPRKLCAALDRLATWATRQHHAHWQSWSHDHPLVSENMDWSSYQFVRMPGREGFVQANTFLGLASQYAILPYVEEKLEKCPGLIKPGRNEASLLENALFFPGLMPGHPHLSRVWVAPGSRFWQREALIHLLLDHGADPCAESLLLCHAPSFQGTTRRG